MTDEQAHMVKALTRCTFQLGSSPKRFVYQLDATLRDSEHDPSDGELTVRQDWYLRRLYYSYRRQIGHSQPKPADFDNPPPGKKSETHPPRTLQDYSFAIERDRSKAQRAELERLKDWNEGRAR